MHNCLLDIWTIISISLNRTNWTDNKVKQGNLHYTHNMHITTSEYQLQIPYKNKEHLFKLAMLSLIIIHAQI